MPSFSSVERQRRDTCDPRLIQVLDKAIEVVHFTILCGHRTKEQQDEAFANQRSTKEWPNSRHNSWPSQAVDIAPWKLDEPHIDWRIDQDLWSLRLNKQKAEPVLENIKVWFSTIYFIIGVAYGMGIELESGSDWNGNFRFDDQNFVDLPHLQLKE